MLADRGFDDVRALDINERDAPAYPIAPINGATHAYDPGAVVLLLRPCHGLFAEYVVRRAVDCDVRAVVYASAAKNKAIDLGRFSRRFKPFVSGAAGADGERAYFLDLRPNKEGP
jgi:hypothetical protein